MSAERFKTDSGNEWNKDINDKNLYPQMNECTQSAERGRGRETGEWTRYLAFIKICSYGLDGNQQVWSSGAV